MLRTLWLLANWSKSPDWNLKQEKFYYCRTFSKQKQKQQEKHKHGINKIHTEHFYYYEEQTRRKGTNWMVTTKKIGGDLMKNGLAEDYTFLDSHSNCGKPLVVSRVYF